MSSSAGAFGGQALRNSFDIGVAGAIGAPSMRMSAS
jgi:hypothetical protein